MRQAPEVLDDYSRLRQALISEYSDPEPIESRIVAAIRVRQGRSEDPRHYYARLRDTFFGLLNEADMEENVDFKSLFINNLHPSTSHYLGISADPKHMSSRELRDMAMKGFNRYKQSTCRQPDDVAVYHLDSQSSHMELEGTPRWEPPRTHPQTRQGARYHQPQYRDQGQYSQQSGDNNRAGWRGVNQNASPKLEKKPVKQTQEQAKPPMSQEDLNALADLLGPYFKSF